MRSVVFTCGALSGGLYANGDETENLNISMDTSRKTQLNYFLSNVSVRTVPENRTIVCYGDSITAQDWPDDLQLRCRKEGFEHTAIIRRATSGSRILREYHCLTYESYGLMGAKRFAHEVPTDGADAVIIQQGINDIIHPRRRAGEPLSPDERSADGGRAYQRTKDVHPAGAGDGLARLCRDAAAHGRLAHRRALPAGLAPRLQ